VRIRGRGWLVLAAGLAVLFGLPAYAETYLIINSTIFASFAILALSLALIATPWRFAGFPQSARDDLGALVARRRSRRCSPGPRWRPR